MRHAAVSVHLSYALLSFEAHKQETITRTGRWALVNKQFQICCLAVCMNSIRIISAGGNSVGFFGGRLYTVYLPSVKTEYFGSFEAIGTLVKDKFPFLQRCFEFRRRLIRQFFSMAPQSSMFTDF